MDDGDGLELARLRERVRDLEAELAGTRPPGGADDPHRLCRLVFDLAPVGMAVLAPDGRWLEVNAELCRLLGYSRPELERLTWADLTPPEQRDGELAAYGGFLSTGDHRRTLEKAYLRRDGTRVEVEVTATLLRRPDGTPDLVLAMVQDVADRRRAAAELRTRERRYRVIAEQTGQMVYDWDVASGSIDWAGAVERITGFSPAEYAAVDIRGWEEMIHPDDRAWATQELDQAGRRSEPYNVEYRLRRRDGSYIWVEDAGVFVGDGAAEPRRMLGTMKDVTERRAAAERLARSEQRYRLLAETAQDVILLHDMSGRLLYANPAALELGGYSEADLRAATVASVIAPEWLADERERMARRRAGDASVFRFETVGLARDGRRVPLEVSSSAVAEDDRIVRILAVARDITERKRAEAALRESERRFREMLETVHLAAVMLDLDGRVTFCNEHLAELAGWTRAELEGRDWFDTIIADGEREEARAAYRTVVEGGAIVAHFERTIRTRGGALRQVVWDATLLRDEEGRVAGVARLGRDVTDIRRLEEQYRQAQKMEAVGQLAGGVAHDFNNLLQVILGYVDLASQGLARGRQPHAELAQVSQAASRASALVRRLLTFSRRDQLRRERLELDQLVADLARMLRRVLGENIDLETSSSGDLPPVLATQRPSVDVITGLINARDAMPGGGTIRIATSAVRLDRAAARRYAGGHEGEYALVAVTDTGSGMTPDVVDHLFEPFFTTKEVGKGTGLGLATVYGIVRQHGGLIEVSTEPGRGSEFRVLLPAAPAGPHGPSPAAGAGATRAGRGETVLVAEDDDQVRALAVAALEQAGYRVLAARDGEEALRLAERDGDRVDLLVLDMVMPRRSGRAVLEAIRATRPGARALFASGYSAESLPPGDRPDGTVPLLQKPFTASELLRAVREALATG